MGEHPRIWPRYVSSHLHSPFLGFSLLSIIMLVTALFVCGGQVICVVGLSFVHNSSEMNVRVGAYQQFEVGYFGENMAFDKI